MKRIIYLLLLLLFVIGCTKSFNSNTILNDDKKFYINVESCLNDPCIIANTSNYPESIYIIKSRPGRMFILGES